MSQLITRKKNNAWDILSLFCLYLATINFFQRFYVFYFLSSLFFFIVNRLTVKFDAKAIFLFFMGLAFMTFAPDSFVKFTFLIKPFTYFVCYISSYTYIYRMKTNKKIETEKNIWRIFTLIMFGNLSYWILNMSVNMHATGREVIDFWNRDLFSATGMAAIGCIPLGWGIANLLYQERKDKKSIFIAGSIIFLILLYNMTLAGRTLIVLLAVGFASGLLFLLFINKSKPSKKIRILLACVIIIALGIYLYQINAFDIQNKFQQTEMYARFFGKQSQSVNFDERDSMKEWYLRHLSQYPFGGDKMFKVYGHRAHDLLLDTYGYAGVFAFIPLFLFMLSALLNSLKIIVNNSISTKLRMLVVCTYSVLLCEFFVEPILIGMQWLFASYVFIVGMLSAYLRISKKHIQ